jgi:hypothetical protein
LLVAQQAGLGIKHHEVMDTLLPITQAALEVVFLMRNKTAFKKLFLGLQAVF